MNKRKRISKSGTSIIISTEYRRSLGIFTKYSRAKSNNYNEPRSTVPVLKLAGRENDKEESTE